MAGVFSELQLRRAPLITEKPTGTRIGNGFLEKQSDLPKGGKAYRLYFALANGQLGPLAAVIYGQSGAWRWRRLLSGDDPRLFSSLKEAVEAVERESA